MARPVLQGKAWSARLADVDAPEQAFVEEDLRAVARVNAAAAAPVVTRRKWVARLARMLVLLVVLASFTWIAGNAFAYRYAAATQGRIEGSHLQTTVVLGSGAGERVDCWYSDSVETVRAAAQPFDSVVPYRCGDGVLAAFIPGPMSALAGGVAVIGSTVLLVRALRRRRSNWY